jgi:hypothetical protein
MGYGVEQRTSLVVKAVAQMDQASDLVQMVTVFKL